MSGSSMAAELPTPAQDPALYADRSGEVVGASVALIVLPTVFVALRLVSRWMAGAGFWWDDFTVILGMILSWGPNITNILASKQSLGRHIAILAPNVIMSFFKYIYAFEITYCLGISVVKYSVLLFQYRIFPIVQFRRIILYCSIFVIIFTVTSLIVFIFECTPIHTFWTAYGGALSKEYGGRCINFINYLLVQGSINTATDFALLLLPMPILWRLRASTLQKCILTGIFVMGLVVTAVSLVRLVVITEEKTRDVTWTYVPICVWTAAEPAIAVTSACIPSLRPLFVRIVWGSNYRPKQDTYLSSGNLSSTWRTGSKAPDRSFNRLADGSTGASGSWKNNVAVYGGKEGRSTEEEMELTGQDAEPEAEIPANRIRAKTTVVLTISERVDWQDDLF